MPKTKISEFSATPASNTDIDSINISEGCAPSGINDAIRELMAQLKDFQTGAVGDSFNGPVGTTTAAAGAFTTLSSTGNTTLGDASGDSVTINGTATFANANPTLSAGTANGVAYLNGSKVLSSSATLTWNNSTQQLGFQNAAATGYAYIGTAGAGSNTDLAFYMGASEGMRLTSTGLGIGTSSPVGKIHAVASSAGATSLLERSTASTAVPVFASRSLATSSGDMADGFGPTHAFAIQDTAAVINPISEIGAVREGADNSGGLVFRTYSAGTATTQMRLDKAGNLGLGVTPSAWGSPFSSVMQFTKGSIACQSNSVILFNNAYYDGSNYRYVNTAGAGYYEQSGGQHIWNRASSGTAGNAITFTQAMTLDASGNLIVGGTSALGNTTNRGNITLNGTSSALYSLGVGGLLKGYLFHGGTDMELQNSANGYLSFATNGSERARIDSSGNLLVGTTSASVTNGGFIVYQSTPTATGIFIGHATGTASGTTYSAFRFNNTDIGSITQSGTTAVLFNTTSDQRLKENIQDADSASTLIDALQVRQFDWKADNSHQRYGFIAQELVTVYPEAVHQPEDTEQMMAVDYSKLVPLLVKEIQSLKARLDAANL